MVWYPDSSPPRPEYSEYKHHMFHMRSLSISWQTGHYVCTLLTLDPDSCSLAVQACSSAKWCISKTNLAMATRALHLWSNKKLSLVSFWKFGGRHGDCDSCYNTQFFIELKKNNWGVFVGSPAVCDWARMKGKTENESRPQLRTNKPASQAGQRVRFSSELHLCKFIATNSGVGHLLWWATPRSLATT